MEHILRIYEENHKNSGYRQITAELRVLGLLVNHKRVLRLMNVLGIRSLISINKRKKYRSYKGDVGKVADNLIDRNFKASKPYEKWTTDITEFRIGDKKLYLSPILDMFNSEIISFVVSTSPNFKQIEDMLDIAFKKLPTDKHPIFHSDQGWQYQNKRYVEALKNKGIFQSMSRKGNCLDNSIMENFFGVMKKEMFYGHEKKIKDIYELEVAIYEYIKYYNNRRIKIKLHGISPVAFREQYNKQNCINDSLLFC